MRLLTLLFVFAAAAFPQALSVGVKGGAPLGDAFKIVSNAASGRSYFQDTKRYTFGPMIDVRLPFGLGIELDALYKGMEYGYTGATGGLSVSSLTKGRAWEFPLIAKYRSPGVLARPYAGLGVSFRRFQGLKQFITRDVPGLVGGKTDTGTPEELNNTFTKGVIFAGGVEIKALVVRISPELRYTRWVNHGFRDVLNVFGSNQNQIEMLIGLTF
jgi:hypothetical protein